MHPALLVVPAVGLIVLLFLAILILPSIRKIGPTEVGLVTKRFSGSKLEDDNPIAFKGEAGYQADLLMPGLRWKFWILYSVEKFPWVQVPAGEIGVVIAQVGEPLPIGAKSAVYKNEFGNFSDLRTFIEKKGQKGVQRPVLTPGSLLPIHPVGFLVITKDQVYGLPVSPELQDKMDGKKGLSYTNFGLNEDDLKLVRIEPNRRGEDGKMTDTIGIIVTRDGAPLPKGDMACRIGGFDDIAKMEDGEEKKTDAELIEALLGSQNAKHNSYQDFQKFIDAGGKIGLQHDPLLYGTYALNPFLVKVEIVPMLVIEQGQVAVIKAYVGLPTKDTSGAEFKFGSIVKPGHLGIWGEPLRTGKFPINPRLYQAEIVPTFILTLNWAKATSAAHNLDANLSQIEAKSREGFVFKIDLQVQIHVPDTVAPRVISRVGSMPNLINEVLQAAVGNHFRNTLQAMPAVKFIETRQQVQEEALTHIKGQLSTYEIETPGVYIQDVVFPPELVAVLTQREIANQEIETYKKQNQAEEQRITMENTKGEADRQADLAASKVEIAIKTNKAQARIKEAEGEAMFTSETGKAKGAEVEAIGLARAKGYEAQVQALGQGGTAAVNIANAMSSSATRFVPDVLVNGSSGGSLDGLAGTLMKFFTNGPSVAPKAPPAPETHAEAEPADAPRTTSGHAESITPRMEE